MLPARSVPTEGEWYMSSNQAVREMVSRQYEKAVTQPGGGCCGTSTCCGGSSKGVLAKTAGYQEEDLAGLPADAVANSFGCGNPLAFSEVRPGEVVLDLGCGAGIDLLIAAQKVGPSGRVIGVDMTDAMIERARANIAAAGLSNIEVRKGLIEQLPVEDGSVDWVISNCVINLSPEKERVFAEIARVLRPGGRLRVSDVVAAHLPDEIRRNADLHASCIAGAISEDAYVAGLRAAGLTDVEVRQRVIYESSQLAALATTEGVAAAETARLAAAAAGKIWSAVFFGRKPVQE